jgi:hypothetical protein
MDIWSTNCLEKLTTRPVLPTMAVEVILESFIIGGDDLYRDVCTYIQGGKITNCRERGDGERAPITLPLRIRR